MERFTRKDAEAAFGRLAAALGKNWGATGYVGSDLKWRALVGVWCLDYNSTYGGFVIHEISNESGGVSEPFGSMRRTAREFCDAVHFALRALELVQGSRVSA